MQQPTDAAPGQERADWCDWHKGPSSTAERVLIERQSGAPYPLEQFACAPCREQRALVRAELPMGV
ncbi:hypothetical protein ABZ208_35290 [Streptomyces sp. NPDC006208]|uniref:hypothetical protein n=1 Tax=Streptomyces sp. NPDC006208 TaxID=3156734 RepID=UPI0033B24371